jgi:hypothetical protein
VGLFELVLIGAVAAAVFSAGALVARRRRQRQRLPRAEARKSLRP